MGEKWSQWPKPHAAIKHCTEANQNRHEAIGVPTAKAESQFRKLLRADYETHRFLGGGRFLRTGIGGRAETQLYARYDCFVEGVALGRIIQVDLNWFAIDADFYHWLLILLRGAEHEGDPAGQQRS